MSVGRFLFLFFPFVTDRSFLPETGGNKDEFDWSRYMFPHVNDRHRPCAPDFMLLPLKGYVPEAEMRNPHNRDIHNVKTLLAVKNGRTTGTTFGRVNGLESVTREYLEHGVRQDALQLVVCGYDVVKRENVRFSEMGDSGAVVVGRDGRLIGLLTGGAGLNGTDRSYIVPFYALKPDLDAKFPGCHLLDVDT